MLECHYGVPMAGAVLNTLNTRLDAAVIAFTLDHAETKVLIVDREFSGVMKEALALRQGEAAGHRLRRSRICGRGERIGAHRLRGFSRRGRPGFRLADARTTNGTRSRSTTRRAPPAIPRAWSITIAARICWRSAMSLTCGMGKHPVYLWTLPMFHCNGWCFPWTISVVGRHACLPALGARGRDVRRDRRPRGHASVRRADRDVDAAQRAGGREEAAAARGRVLHRRRAAAGSGARRR